jgi:hypothetical protein
MALSEAEEAWARYFAKQLSESERAESRVRMLADLQQAKEEGVFHEIDCEERSTGPFPSKSFARTR